MLYNLTHALAVLSILKYGSSQSWAILFWLVILIEIRTRLRCAALFIHLFIFLPLLSFFLSFFSYFYPTDRPINRRERTIGNESFDGDGPRDFIVCLFALLSFFFSFYAHNIFNNKFLNASKLEVRSDLIMNTFPLK